MLMICFVLLSLFCCVNGGNLSSSKRGVVYVGNENPSDDDVWNAANSDLTWYYNYFSYPESGIEQSKLQFVPMMWGAGPQYAGFQNTVEGLLNNGMDVKFVLGFNEPDGCSGGGSCVDAKTAAQTWKQEIEPLKKYGIKLGAPAVIGGDSAWLDEFYSFCAGGCTTDFIPLHYYGDFLGLQGWVYDMHAAYPNVPLWVTEFAYANATLLPTQQFYNQSVAFLDGLPYVIRYSYFGSFRSDESNIGPCAAMLNTVGELTDIGAWYLGRHATGIGPKSEGVVTFTYAGWPLLAIAAVFIYMV